MNAKLIIMVIAALLSGCATQQKSMLDQAIEHENSFWNAAKAQAIAKCGRDDFTCKAAIFERVWVPNATLPSTASYTLENIVRIQKETPDRTERDWRVTQEVNRYKQAVMNYCNDQEEQQWQRNAMVTGMIVNNMQQTQRNAVDIGIASGYQQAIIGSRAPLLINPMPMNYNGVVPIQRFNRY